MTNYVEFNANPNNERKGDCYLRAISLGEQIDYYEAEELLKANQVANNHLYINSNANLISFLEMNGYKAIKGISRRVNTVINALPKDIKGYLFSSEHVVFFNSGQVFDTWNSTNKVVKTLLVPTKDFERVSSKLTKPKRKDLEFKLSGANITQVIEIAEQQQALITQEQGYTVIKDSTITFNHSKPRTYIILDTKANYLWTTDKDNYMEIVR